jgi:hypothetical protein
MKGVNNMIDILSGKNYIYVPSNDEDKIKQMLIGHSIEKVNNNTLKLDNGIELEFYGNEGCSCGAGDYDITELNECKNIITNVEFVEECIDSDGWGEEYSYKIFVYAENKKIKLLQCDGNDGNGYYGTGYHIKVRNLKEGK